MPSFRAILSLVLVLVTTLLVSCGNPAANVPPPTYTPEKIAQLQTIAEPIDRAKERLAELEGYISQRSWFNIRDLIHGPLGQLRQDMKYLSESLLPKDQPEAKKVAKQLFVDLEALDAAAKDHNYGACIDEYSKAVRDFNNFLNLVPKAS